MGLDQAAAAWSSGSLPVPGQEFVEPGGRVIGDALQHVGEPGLQVDFVELGGADQRVDGGGPLAAAVGAGEQPGFAAECDTAQRPLGGIFGEANAAVIKEASEGGPALSVWSDLTRPGRMLTSLD